MKSPLAEGFFLTILLLFLNSISHLKCMKKKALIPVLLFIIILSGFIQVKSPVKKTYGYKQASIPGIVPSYSEETDIQPVKNRPKQNYNYWFYLEIARSEKINMTGLWISGVQYDIKADTITDLPVRKININHMGKNDTIIMVPVTKNNVILVYPSGESKNTTKIDSKYTRQLIGSNELVIRYLWKNQTYYSAIKKLKELDPDVRP